MWLVMGLVNGVDTYLTQKLLKQKRYRITTDKAIGVKAMTLQNEDYEWRQFQLGIWVGANLEKWASDRRKRRLLQRQRTWKEHIALVKKDPTLIMRFIFLVALKYAMQRILDEPTAYIWLKTFIYQHPYLMKGYKWALKHEDHEVVKLARTMDEYEWGFEGARHIRGLGVVEVEGTGAQ